MAELSTLNDLVNAVGDQAVSLAVHAGGGLRVPAS